PGVAKRWSSTLVIVFAQSFQSLRTAGQQPRNAEATPPGRQCWGTPGGCPGRSLRFEYGCSPERRVWPDRRQPYPLQRPGRHARMPGCLNDRTSATELARENHREVLHPVRTRGDADTHVLEASIQDVLFVAG